MNLDIRTAIVGGNRLVDDYVRAEPALAPFFPGHPFDPGAYRRKAGEVRARLRGGALHRAVDAVRPSGDAAAEKLRAIAGGNGFFVTTGQQPGLFTGPLYTIHKALSALALAHRLESILDEPVLPLFWIASDDHDWEEASHTSLLDTGNTLHRLELTRPPGDAQHSMGRTPLRVSGHGSIAERALDELGEILPPSEFTPPIMERLRDAYGQGSVADAFARALEGVLESFTLGFVDSRDPLLRELARPVVRRELEGATEHEGALRRQTERLEAAGYGIQVPILAGAANVFVEDDDHGRERLVREDGAWVLRRSRRRLEDAALTALLEREPERFSPNVVLRPVVESAVFPTLAYVGGPGEVRYLAQTGCLFAAHGVGMPVVFPRFGVTLVEGKVGKVLERFELEPSSFGRPVHELVADVVREEVPPSVQEALSRLRRSIQEGYGAVTGAASEIDPTLESPIKHARGEAFKGVAEVERKIRQHLKMRQESELEQLEKAAANLAPTGKPQERVLNIHQYLSRYGPELLPAILDSMQLPHDAPAPEWTGVSCD